MTIGPPAASDARPRGRGPLGTAREEPASAAAQVAEKSAQNHDPGRLRRHPVGVGQQRTARWHLRETSVPSCPRACSSTVAEAGPAQPGAMDHKWGGRGDRPSATADVKGWRLRQEQLKPEDTQAQAAAADNGEAVREERADEDEQREGTLDAASTMNRTMGAPSERSAPGMADSGQASQRQLPRQRDARQGRRPEASSRRWPTTGGPGKEPEAQA